MNTLFCYILDCFFNFLQVEIFFQKLTFRLILPLGRYLFFCFLLHETLEYSTQILDLVKFLFSALQLTAQVKQVFLLTKTGLYFIIRDYLVNQSIYILFNNFVCCASRVCPELAVRTLPNYPGDPGDPTRRIHRLDKLQCVENQVFLFLGEFFFVTVRKKLSFLQ